MTDFTVLIGRESRMLARLHGEVHRSFRERGKGAAARQRWQEACAAFHSYRSPMAPHVDAAMRAERYDEPAQRAFVLRFLELDLRYFGSGYAKEAMLPRLARAALDRIAAAKPTDPARSSRCRMMAAYVQRGLGPVNTTQRPAKCEQVLCQPAFGASGVRP